MEREFQREYIRENLGCSLIKDAGPIYNGAVVTNDFDYCVFSSPKSISLILENVPQSERFFIIDGTFRITPKGVWQQTLIVHVMYKSKVRQRFSSNCVLISFQISDLGSVSTGLPAGIYQHVKKNNKCIH